MMNKTESPTIIWFRKALRLWGNPALTQSVEFPIIPLFILDDEDPYNPGGASQWWLHKSLISLQNSLSAYGAH